MAVEDKFKSLAQPPLHPLLDALIQDGVQGRCIRDDDRCARRVRATGAACARTAPARAPARQAQPVRDAVASARRRRRRCRAPEPLGAEGHRRLCVDSHRVPDEERGQEWQGLGHAHMERCARRTRCAGWGADTWAAQANRLARIPSAYAAVSSIIGRRACRLGRRTHQRRQRPRPRVPHPLLLPPRLPLLRLLLHNSCTPA
jgi:hypothetical protein